MDVSVLWGMKQMQCILPNREVWLIRQRVVLPSRGMDGMGHRLEEWTNVNLTEVQQGEVRSPAPGEEQPQAPVYSGGRPAGKQLGRKGPGGAGGPQVERQPAMCPWGKEGEWYPGLHKEECCQQVKDGDPTALLSTGHLECCVQFWASRGKRGMDILERVQ